MTLQLTAGDLVDNLTPLIPVFAGRDRFQTKVRLDTTDGALRLRGASAPTNHWWEADRAVEAVKGEVGDILVDFRPLIGLASLADSPSDSVTLDYDGERLTALTPSFRVRLPAITPAQRMNDFAGSPAYILPKWDESGLRVWDAPALRGPLKFAAGSASTDDCRPILTTICVHPSEDGKKVTVAATDSYRLSVLDVNGNPPPTDDGLLLGAHLAKVLPDGPSTINVYRQLDSTWIEWKDKGTTWRSYVMDRADQFPNYRGLLPKGQAPVRATLARDQTMALLNRLNKIAKLSGMSAWNSSVPMVLDIQPGGIDVSIGADGRVDGVEFFQHMACDTVGELKVAFNPIYFSSGVKAIEHPVLSLSAWDAQKPAVMSSEGFTYLVMPIRVR